METDISTIQDYADIMLAYDPKNNRTKNILSKYEFVKILGLRAESLTRGAEPLIKWTPPFNPVEIAKEEIRQRKCPYFICRKLPDGVKEYYRLDDLIILY